MQKKAYLLVEGKGEVEAAGNLVARMGMELGFPLPWASPMRWNNLHLWEARKPSGVRNGAEFFRNRGDVGSLLILRDEDDACPRMLAPEISGRLRTLCLPFPVAYVLLHPEYEVLFLPCLPAMGYPPWNGATWEARRGIKEWLTSQLPRGRSYKPTVDQLPMTRKIDFAVIRQSGVPCFGSLERAIQFLGDHEGTSSAYP